MPASTRAVTPLLRDITEANNNNFESVPGHDSKSMRRGWASRIVRRCDIETVLYMIEPWERLLVQAVCVLFFASALHFAIGNNWMSFFE